MFKNLLRRTPKPFRAIQEAIKVPTELEGPTKLPAKKVVKVIQQDFPTEHGYQIYTYVNYRTRQTIYSLTQNLRPQHLKQLTFVGKKSVPSSIRKDMWTPLCVLNFPNRFQGLHAYARLREFKIRHETEWDIEDFTWKAGPNAGQRMGSREAGKRKRGNTKMFKLMDQKANSIADMAAVLEMQSRPPEEEDIVKYEPLVQTQDEMYTRTKRGSKCVPRSRAKRGLQSLIGHRVFEFQGKIHGTSIWWQDPHDAAHAQSWPEGVVHGALTVRRDIGIQWPPIVKMDIHVPEGTKEQQDESLAESIKETKAKATIPPLASYARPLGKGEELSRAEQRELTQALRVKIADAKSRVPGAVLTEQLQESVPVENQASRDLAAP